MHNEIELEDEQFYRVRIGDKWLVGRWNEEGGGWFDVLGAFGNTFGKYGRCEMQEIGGRIVMPDEGDGPGLILAYAKEGVPGVPSPDASFRPGDGSLSFSPEPSGSMVTGLVASMVTGLDDEEEPEPPTVPDARQTWDGYLGKGTLVHGVYVAHEGSFYAGVIVGGTERPTVRYEDGVPVSIHDGDLSAPLGRLEEVRKEASPEEVQEKAPPESEPGKLPKWLEYREKYARSRDRGPIR